MPVGWSVANPTRRRRNESWRFLSLILKKTFMIVDSLKNAAKYYALHPSFARAFEYIQITNPDTTEQGKYEVDEDRLKAIFSTKTGMTLEASTAKFECHNNHIDIQLCIHGVETIGWKPREKCMVENGGYNPEKDVQLYSDAPDTFFQLTDGQFAIFFPEDVHAPMIGTEEIKKLVIKVKI
jgi:YhcH/YjgK/YiaL family protein